MNPQETGGSPQQDIAAVILAGGKSTRFGSNKALASLLGKTLVGHVAEVFTGLFSRCLLVTNTPEDYGFLGLPMIGDIYRDAGPMAGIHAGLMAVEEQWIFVTACDMPMVERGLISYLCNLDRRGMQAVIPWLARGPEPLCGLYHRDILTLLETRLAKGERKAERLLDLLKVRRVDADEIRAAGADLGSFHNVNFPEDLKYCKGKV